MNGSTMPLPDIPHEIRDPARNIKFVVFAYRRLSREEVVETVRAWTAQQKRKPAAGSEIRIVTTIGFDDR